MDVSLLTTLNSTDPHFICCIVPNNVKTPGLLDSALVMHQLTCNGVLEGIRICRRGFPNRCVYADFKHRFVIIKPKEVHALEPDLKAGTKAILESIEEVNDRWRLGHTKVFFILHSSQIASAYSLNIVQNSFDTFIKNHNILDQ